MTFFKAFRRALRQSWTYGITSDDLTKREKRMWVSMFYFLATACTYYAVKDIAREEVQGHFGMRDVLDFIIDPFGEKKTGQRWDEWEALPESTREKWDHDFEAWAQEQTVISHVKLIGDPEAPLTPADVKYFTKQ